MTTQTHDPLDDLSAQAAVLESGPLAESDTPGQPGAPGEVAKLTNEQVFGGAIAAAREAFCLFTKLTSPKVVLTDAKVQQLAALWCPVLDKHGISLGQYIGDYALEMAAVIGTIGIASELRTMVSAELTFIKKQSNTDAVTDGNGDTQS